MQFVERREQGNALIKSRKGHRQVLGVLSANRKLSRNALGGAISQKRTSSQRR